MDTFGPEEAYPYLISGKTIDGENPLISAAKYGFTGLLRYLIPQPINVENIALWKSVQYGRLESIQILLENRPNNLEDFLKTAINSGQLETFKYLVQRGANIEAQTFFFTARDNLEIFEYLVSLGVEIHDTTLNHLVYYGCDPQIIRCLLKLRPWPQDNLDRSLVNAIIDNRVEIAQMLIEKGSKTSQKYLNNIQNHEMKALLYDHPESIQN